eukprot:m.258433 g.258433  ORF g.258433 m.258433 type:complete len:81 (-) comp36579_c0_seq1:393-635(-)
MLQVHVAELIEARASDFVDKVQHIVTRQQQPAWSAWPQTEFLINHSATFTPLVCLSYILILLFLIQIPLNISQTQPSKFN